MPGTGASGGRNAKDAGAHVLAGTFRSDRHGGFDTPEAPAGRPSPPRPLEGEAAEEWERMVDRLEKTGALSVVDDAAIYAWCCLWVETEEKVIRQQEYRASAQILEENLHGLKGPDLVACFQEIVKVRQLEAGCDNKILAGRMAQRQWLVEFGLTPAARSRVKLPPKKPVSKVDAFRQAKAGA